MSDAAREEPQPDRLRGIRTRLKYANLGHEMERRTYTADIEWLVAEVERLREGNKRMLRELEASEEDADD